MVAKKKSGGKSAKKKASSKKPVVKAKAKSAKPKAKAKAKRKAKPKAKPAKKVEPGFATLAPWKKVAVADAPDFDFLEATNDSVGYADCFGREPAHLMIHQDDVKI